MTGIEPALSAWEAEVLPLNYIGMRHPSDAALTIVARSSERVATLAHVLLSDRDIRAELDRERIRLEPYEPVRPERLAHPYFTQSEPEELLIDEIEAIWADIDQRDDRTAFHAKLARIETARVAWGLS